nr:unnamed protein product [Callosobruchus chinensis]
MNNPLTFQSNSNTRQQLLFWKGKNGEAVKLLYTCTVALDMQAKATKSFSFRLSLQPIPQTTVLSILIKMATSKIPTHIETTGPSSSLILIEAPVNPKRIGSKIIQKISKAVAAGLSSISQPAK